MTNESKSQANDKAIPAPASTDLVQDLEARVSADDADAAKGGSRVKTSDKNQAAVLAFIKG